MQITGSIHDATLLGKRLAELEWGMLHVIEKKPCALIWGRDVKAWYAEGFFDDGWFEWHHSPAQTKVHLQQAGLIDSFPSHIFVSFQRVNHFNKPGYQERIYISRSALGNTVYCPFQAYIKEKFKRAGMKKTEALSMMR